MPAIDAAMTPPSSPSTEARPSSQTSAKPVKAGETTETGSHAADAFIAALLAQSVPQAAGPEVAPAVTEGGPLVNGGQELPAMRPTLATGTGSRRAAAPAPADNLPASTVADASVVDDGAHDEFAAAFTALQDAMTGGAGGERGQQSDGDGIGTLGGAGSLSDLSNALSGTTPRGETATSQGLDALTGAHAARTQEAPATAPTYAAKPAALPMDQPALFAERLNQHISFMIGDQVQSAQIAVTPADLGPVEVRVTMVGDEAKIQLSATHAATREALNDALPRLRASFAEAGINLGQAGVFAQMPERQQAEPPFGGQPPSGERDFDASGLVSRAPTRSLRVGLIDAFV